MKKGILLSILTVFALITSWTESPVLFVYEENNENINPWINRLDKQFEAEGISFEKYNASELPLKDLSSFDRIFFYGAVMAFTFMEPLRDWLDENPDLSGKEITLFVTANRWFLDKYTNQLQERLEERGGEVVDTISSATQKLTDEEKSRLIDRAVAALAN